MPSALKYILLGALALAVAGALTLTWMRGPAMLLDMAAAAAQWCF